MRDVVSISRIEADALISEHHYLAKIGARFKSGTNFGLLEDGQLVGACVFTGFPVAELFKSIWGVDDFRGFDQSGFYELSRLVLHPLVQHRSGIHADCTASWFVSRCLRKMKAAGAKAVLSYADSDYHNGTVYAASNFKYYGKTAPKFNIWIPDSNGVYLPQEKRPGRPETHWRQMSRGWRVHLDNGGIKVPRGVKHRFLRVCCKRVKAWPILWQEERWRNAQ